MTNKELNIIVESARVATGCYGARMTGAGFGGCAVALVRAGMAEQFVELIRQCYFETTVLISSVYVCEPSNGAEVMTL